MKNWLLRRILKRREYLTEKQRESFKTDDNKNIDKVIEKMKEDNDKKDSDIRDLLIDILLIEDEINKQKH